MNSVGRSRIALAMAMLACACGREKAEINQAGINLVSSDRYDSDNCWFDHDQEFSSFLVISREDDVGIPYFISVNCLVDGEYSSNGEATLLHLKAIRMNDESGVLQRGFPGITIVGNVATDLPTPTSEAPVFYFRGHLRAAGGTPTVYFPESITRLTDTGIPFERFLGLSREQRDRLAKTYN